MLVMKKIEKTVNTKVIIPFVTDEQIKVHDDAMMIPDKITIEQRITSDDHGGFHTDTTMILSGIYADDMGLEQELSCWVPIELLDTINDSDKVYFRDLPQWMQLMILNNEPTLANYTTSL